MRAPGPIVLWNACERRRIPPCSSSPSGPPASGRAGRWCPMGSRSWRSGCAKSASTRSWRRDGSTGAGWRSPPRRRSSCRRTRGNVPQPGAGFGARLERAMLDAFERGAGPLLVVGTDVPGLAPRHLERALALLDEDADRVVLGPSPDGGFYLLAARRPSTGSRRRSAGAGARRSAICSGPPRPGRPVALLAPVADLDRPADLRALAGRAARRTGAGAGSTGSCGRPSPACAAPRRPAPVVPRRSPRPASPGAPLPLSSPCSRSRSGGGDPPRASLSGPISWQRSRP